MNRKLSDWASIAEIVAAFAIVASLVFVGIQVMQNTKATRAETVNAMTIALLEVNKLTTDPNLAELYVQMSTEGMYALGPVEFQQMSSYSLAYFRALQAFYYQYSEGVLEPSLWTPHEDNLRRVLSNDDNLTWWKDREFMFYESFVNYVNSELLP